MFKEDLIAELRGCVVVVGVGDLDRGDDGVGCSVAQMLKDMAVDYVVDSGNLPELDTWRIREMSPDTLIFVDAVDIKGSPGDIAILYSNDLRSFAFETHHAPLRLTMEYLERELGCRCLLLAVQPANIGLGVPMSDKVRTSAVNLANILAEVVTSYYVANKVEKR